MTFGEMRNAKIVPIANLKYTINALLTVRFASYIVYTCCAMMVKSDQISYLNIFEKLLHDDNSDIFSTEITRHSVSQTVASLACV